MRNDDRCSRAVPTTTEINFPEPSRRAQLSDRPATPLLTEMPLAEQAYEEGAIDGAHLRILAAQVRRLPLELRPVFDELGTALARELPWHSLLPVAAKLRRHLHGSRG